MPRAYSAELFMYPRETLTVYPFWRIELYFDKLYYSAYGIRVGIWADIKQIEYCKSLSYTGGPPDEENPTAPPDGSTGQTNLDPTPIMIAVPIVLVIILGVAVYRRKKMGKR